MDPLRESLSPEQEALLRVLFARFDAVGRWPVWQYAETILEADGTDARAVLASLPRVGDTSPTSHSYGLTWRNDSYMAPHLDARVAVTIAGLTHLPEAVPL